MPRALAGLLLAFALAPVEARAYCLLTTDQPLRSTCPEVCVESGEPVFWAEHDILYTFNEALLPDLDETTTRRVFKNSFDAWTSVSCEGNRVDLLIEQDPRTTSVDEAVHGDNINVVIYRSPGEWAELHEGSRRAFALTQVWYRTATGEVVGADMELNGSLGTYRECPARDGCDPGSGEVDLANVITHEAGHFLGLAHSEVPGSTMYCDADPWEVNKRSLSRDDTQGICAIYGPLIHRNDAGLSDASTGSKRGGGCQAGDPTAGWTVALIGALGWLLGSRLRRRRPGVQRG